MKKAKLDAAVAAAKAETKEAIEVILAALNHGQRKKLASDPKVAELLKRYGMEGET